MGKNQNREKALGIDDQSSEDGYLLAALQQLHAKLLAAQPRYIEEDVVVAYPSPCGSPTHLPGRLSCDRGADWDQNEFLWVCRDGVVANEKSDRSAATSSPGKNTPSLQAIAVDLDKPLTPYEFLMAVGKFEAESVLRSRKAVVDVLKLMNHGYALTWRDKRHISCVTLTANAATSSRSTATARREIGGRGNTAGLATTRRSVFASSFLFSVPTYSPPQTFVKLMSKCAELLLVYANESPSLRTMATSNSTFLRMLCFVCGESKKLESRFSDEGWRDIDEELNELVSHWQAFPVTLPLLGALKECYLVDFLLDVALPPAVCSSRFDGIATVLLEKKERLIVEMMSSRTGFGTMTKGLPLRGLAALINMSMFAESKLRARVLDRMIGEGLMQTLLDELTDILEEGMRLVGSVDDGQLSSKKLGDLSSALPDLNETCGKKKILVGFNNCSPARRLGYCLDILQCLTAPNLLPEGSSSSTRKGVVRATAWASQAEELQGICFCLLRLASILLHEELRYLLLHSFQEQAMNCVCQIASYSAVLYRTVVETLDGVLCEYCRGKRSERDNSASSLLQLVLALLRLKQHAEANEECVARWFVWLTECLVPQAFDVPVLTCSVTNDRRLWKRGARKRLSKARCETPVLARDLRRDEILSLSPYFYFASRLILETSWRYGAEPFLTRIALLAHHVLFRQARRPNLIFGQASLCYDTVAPLLGDACGALPAESTAGSCDSPATPGRPSGRLSGGSSPSGRKRRRSALQGDAGAEEEVFISSPSNSPVLLGAYSPTTLEANSGGGSDGCSPVDESECCSTTSTSSWRQRFSISAYLAALGEFFS